ncbi:uncharacterized protein DNG_02707 [Cephalotrichum gorgonifer]|uniref:DUF4336 domain-containing protein n=1 Tax=Cephalotrichum gorgonifer TaxID=2041049 RepID=A0AAE8MTH5_9PEZI|nr:uncharacterized protein DNG_02707 [Cephalotrichum gorgonifer]
MPPLFPADPAPRTVIRALTPNITTVSLPFSRMGRISFGARATLVRLSSGSLAVFSPVPLTAPVRTAVESLAGGDRGGVKYVIAPDIEHHLYISDWKSEFPSAKLLGPRGLPEKRAKAGMTESFDVVFAKSGPEGGKVDEEFDRDFEVEYVAGHPNREVAFLYKPDKVLIQADLMFNLPPEEQYSLAKEERTYGILDKLFAAVTKTEGDMTWTRRFMWYAISRANREGFNKSVRRIDGWDFDTVVPCHGDTMVGDGKERFRRVFQWHLDAKKED